jgi:LL-diaminopimelate aminotransferase
MVKLNTNFRNLKESYLFSGVARRIREFKAANPSADIIRLSIGDVTRPLTAPVVDALVKASKEMGVAETFRGYGDEQGYGFLQLKIKEYYQKTANVTVEQDEIFISDGAKSDIGNFTDMFDTDNIVLVPDPVYPVYVDSNLMDGRKIVYIQGCEANGFLPLPEEKTQADIIYLCSPNNPTGAVYTREQLKVWVDFALKKGAIILFDAAYESFISDSSLPRSIFEVEGAKDCAVEFCSLSKTAGFTGTRCGYTVVPKNIVVDGVSLNRMWLRRQTTKFNGTSYIVQRGAEAVFTSEGYASCRQSIAYYMENARMIASTLDKLGIWHTGGVNSPYIWLRCGMDSWDYFDYLLREANVAGTPGSGFGKCGEGYFRLTAFNTKERTAEALARIAALYNR